MADGGFAEDFPSDIERELHGEWDQIVVCGWRKGELVGGTGRRFVGCVRHMAVV